MTHPGDTDSLRDAVRRDQRITGPEPECPECGTTTTNHARGCRELARIQRRQLDAWRRGGGNPGPHWIAREREIARLLDVDKSDNP